MTNLSAWSKENTCKVPFIQTQNSEVKSREVIHKGNNFVLTKGPERTWMVGSSLQPATKHHKPITSPSGYKISQKNVKNQLRVDKVCMREFSKVGG